MLVTVLTWPRIMGVEVLPPARLDVNPEDFIRSETFYYEVLQVNQLSEQDSESFAPQKLQVQRAQSSF